MSYLGLYLPFPLPLQTARSPSFTFLGHLNLVSHFYELLVPLAVSVLDHRMRRLVGETAAPVLLVCAVLAEVGRADKAFESQADDFALVFAVGRVLAAKLMLKYTGPAFAFEFLLEYTDLLFYFIQGLSQMLFFEFLELALELSSCILYSFLQGRVLFAGPLVILEQKLLMNLDGFELRSQIVNLLGMQISNPCYLLLSLSQPLLELIHFLRFRRIFVKKVAEINIAIARILQIQNLNFQLAHKQLVIRLIVDRDFFFALVQITQMVILLSLNVQQLTEFLSELGVIQIMVAYQFVHLFAAKQEFNFYSLPIF